MRLLVPIGFLGLFFAYPLGRTVQAATWDAWAWIGTPYVQERLLGALFQATLSVLLTFAIAVPLAWHHHTRAIPWSRVHLAVHAAPFVLPVFVVVGGMRELFGPTGWLHAATGFDLLGAVGPLGAIVLAHAYYNYGFTARLLAASLERRPHRLEEAAMSLGASPGRAFLRTTARLLWPSVLSVALLVFLFCFTSFGVVLLLGQGDQSTLETLLYQNLGGVLPRYDRAAALGLLQLVLNVALLGGYMVLRRREVRLTREPPRAPAPARPRDRRIAVGALAIGLAPALAVLVGGFRVRGQWSLEAWRSLLDHDHPEHPFRFDVLDAIGLSLAYAAASAAMAVTLALLLGYGLRRTGRLRPVAEAFATLPLGASSVLLGFGYLISFGAGSWLDLRGTRAIIVIAHTLVALPFVARTFLPALEQHDTRLDEAAATLGARPWQVAWRIHAPLLRGPLVAATGFAVAMSLGDFGASLVLARPDTMPLAVWIAEVGAPFRALAHAQSIALSATLMVLASLAYLAVEVRS